MGLPNPLQPLIERGILGMGGQVSLKHQAHGIALQTQRRLHPNPNVSKVNAPNVQLIPKGFNTRFRETTPLFLNPRTAEIS